MRGEEEKRGDFNTVSRGEGQMGTKPPTYTHTCTNTPLTVSDTASIHTPRPTST